MNKLCILLIADILYMTRVQKERFSDLIQIKVLWFWVTIKEFDEDEYYDAVDCFRYCTNPYIN